MGLNLKKKKKTSLWFICLQREQNSLTHTEGKTKSALEKPRKEALPRGWGGWGGGRGTPRESKICRPLETSLLNSTPANGEYMWRNEQNLKANSPFSGMRKHFELNSSSHQHDWRQENGFISVNCGMNQPSRITWSHRRCGSLNDHYYRRDVTSVVLWTVAQPVWTLRCVCAPVWTNAKADVKWRSSALAACMGLKRTKRRPLLLWSAYFSYYNKAVE